MTTSSIRIQIEHSILVWLAALSLFCSAATAQEVKRSLIQRDMRTGRDSVVQSFGTPNVPFDTARADRNWGKLKKGLSEDEVRKLLGRPGRLEMDPENALHYWWYGRRAVAFSAVKRTSSFWDK